ncbi:MAG: hypothetical protein ACD_75C00722G0002 [uncultured bacterium]|nr:MAG: hypothetical protein ACD_75C00722G0002 [uncultured bacterium]
MKSQHRTATTLALQVIEAFELSDRMVILIFLPSSASAFFFLEKRRLKESPPLETSRISPFAPIPVSFSCSSSTTMLALPTAFFRSNFLLVLPVLLKRAFGEGKRVQKSNNLAARAGYCSFCRCNFSRVRT